MKFEWFRDFEGNSWTCCVGNMVVGEIYTRSHETYAVTPLGVDYSYTADSLEEAQKHLESMIKELYMTLNEAREGAQILSLERG